MKWWMPRRGRYSYRKERIQVLVYHALRIVNAVVTIGTLGAWTTEYAVTFLFSDYSD